MCLGAEAETIRSELDATRGERPCPVCGACEPRPHAEVQGQRFVRCGDCRSLYLAQPPDWTAIGQLYQSPSYQHARGHRGDEGIEAAKMATTAAYLRLLDRHSPPGRRYLEVGCSAGVGLLAAAAAGWEVQGVEISEHAATIARQRRGVGAVHAGTVLAAPLAPRSFDVVTLFDAIEHIDPPHPTLTRIHELLRDGGLLLLVTPDAGSVSARLMGRRWPHLFPEHVICFTRDAMRRALAGAGFEIVRTGFACKRVNLNMVIRHAQVHTDVVGGGVLRWLDRALPEGLVNWTVPFNIGEFYVIARRPRR